MVIGRIQFSAGSWLETSFLSLLSEPSIGHLTTWKLASPRAMEHERTGKCPLDRKPRLSPNLRSDIPSFLLCCLLEVIQKVQLILQEQEITELHEYQEIRIIGGHLRGCLLLGFSIVFLSPLKALAHCLQAFFFSNKMTCQFDFRSFVGKLFFST